VINSLRLSSFYDLISKSQMESLVIKLIMSVLFSQKKTIGAQTDGSRSIYFYEH